MSWINFFFFVIILNTVTGTVAYLLCKLLTWIAEKAGAIRVIYPMYRLVLIFYTLPFGWIYICIKCNQVYGSYGIGDSFFGTSIIFWIIQIALIVWLIGMVWVIVRKLKDSYGERKAHELKMKNNMPFRADEYRAMLSRMYPHRNWKRIQFCTNFLTRSPVVVGKLFPVIIIPERKYSEFQIQVILMHEGMHIVRLDNLAKRISSVLIYINWFNPYLKSYTKELDEWADIACDISVCKRFLGGNSKEYYIALMAAKTSGHSVVNPFVSHLNKSNESIKRRMMYMKKWKDSRSKRFVSAILMATLIMGSSVTAFAASSQVADQQNDVYRETCESEQNASYFESSTEIHMIPADQVDEEKWNEAVVYEEDLLEPLTVQKNFTWTVPADNFARSAGFIKQKGGQIVVSCYLYSELNHRVGIRRPDGSQLYVLGTHQVAATFPCEKTGTYYVYVENMGRVDIKASGYYIR
ncbi:M56 family metallopeptidase [Eubacterium sp.]|uniref:M56 family metallopeptidase n=1 Tax=Eubacterium sp. TaxID=142586 RepID=UPI003AB15658